MSSCPECGCEEIRKAQSGPHEGEFCAACGKWIKWLKQNPDNGEWATDKQDTYARYLVKKFMDSNQRMTVKQAGTIISFFKEAY